MYSQLINKTTKNKQSIQMIAYEIINMIFSNYIIEMSKKLQAAARDSLKRRHETHIGIKHGGLTAEVAGGSYLSKFNRMLNHINY